MAAQPRGVVSGNSKLMRASRTERGRLRKHSRPSLNTLLGVTQAKKRLKKELGITAALKPFRAWTNAKRRFKRKIGYESEAGRLVRDGLPKPGGCLVVVVVVVSVSFAVILLMIR